MRTSDELIAQIVQHTSHHESDVPVSVGAYTVVVIMNEEDPSMQNNEYAEAFASELQRALDAGFFADLRYDAMTFNVSREHVATFNVRES